MTHTEKIAWMSVWAGQFGATIALGGECGFGRPCVGLLMDSTYPDYHWYDEKTFEDIDDNGDVWTPEDAYHKHTCVAVLGRGESAEEQLYEWLKWFDDNGFGVETGDLEPDPKLPLALALAMGKTIYARMVRKVGVDA